MTRIANLALLLLLPLPLFLAACGGGEETGEATEHAGGTRPAEHSSEEVLDRAAALAQSEKLEEATRLLEEQVALHPADDSLRLALSEALRLRDEVPKAVRVLRDGLAQRPTSGALAAELASLYMSLEQPGLAESTLRAARAAGAGDGDDLAYRLGLSLARSGRFAEARDEFLRAKEAGSDPLTVGYSLAMLSVQDGRYAEAVEQLESLHELDSTRMDVVRELGRCRLALQPHDKDVALQVIGDVDRVLLADPEDWYSFEILGDAYMMLEDYPAALAHYYEALRFGQNPPRVEDRYRAAMIAGRRSGVFPKDDGGAEPEYDKPVLPTSMEHLDGFYRKQKPR